MNQPTADVTPPIVYPTLDIGGVVYTLKFSQLAQFRLEQMGYGPQRLVEILSDAEQIKQAPLTLVYSLVAACAGTMKSGQWKRAKLEPEDLAESISPDRFQECCDAAFSALVKAQPVGSQAAATPAKPQPMTDAEAMAH